MKNNYNSKKLGVQSIIAIVIWATTYTLLFGLLSILEKSAPTGVCNPGLGLIVGFFLVPTTWISLLILGMNFVKKKGNGYWVLIILNLLTPVYFFCAG